MPCLVPRARCGRWSTSALPFLPLLQATRAYLHAEKDVEAALQRAGFKVGAPAMTAPVLFCPRLFSILTASFAGSGTAAPLWQVHSMSLALVCGVGLKIAVLLRRSHGGR